MSFSGFFDAIHSPALKNIVAHRHGARESRMMPAWADIKPAAIARQLGIVWVYKYDRAKDEFTGRLSGHDITQTLGKNIRGLSLAEVQPPEFLVWIRGICRRVVLEPALYQYEGRVYRHLDRIGLGERIMLPLADDGVTGDGILGATEY